jgi:hypothetical protein
MAVAEEARGDFLLVRKGPLHVVPITRKNKNGSIPFWIVIHNYYKSLRYYYSQYNGLLPFIEFLFYP